MVHHIELVASLWAAGKAKKFNGSPHSSKTAKEPVKILVVS